MLADVDVASGRGGATVRAVVAEGGRRRRSAHTASVLGRPFHAVWLNAKRAPVAQLIFTSVSPWGLPAAATAVCDLHSAHLTACARSLQALQGYYFDGDMKMTDVEFENLKDELLWSGSQVAILSSTEQRFLEAMMAYSRGKPILDDDEFDELKGKLKASGSIVVQAGPRCSIRSRRVYSDAEPDYFKMTLINVPATLIVLGVIFSIDDLTGFEITKAIELPQPYSLLFLWGLVFPLIFVTASSITAAILPDNLILKADCPNCGANNQAYFGGIFNVAGNTKSATVECQNCLADLEFDNIKREVVVVTSAEDKQAAAAAAAKKKAAAAAKKKAKMAAKAGASNGDDDE